MILRFHHKGLERLFTTGVASGVAPQQVPRLLRILAQLHVIQEPSDMNLPGFRLHPLKGERKGQWAVVVSGNMRIVFGFEGTDATDVDLVDYH